MLQVGTYADASTGISDSPFRDSLPNMSCLVYNISHMSHPHVVSVEICAVGRRLVLYRRRSVFACA